MSIYDKNLKGIADIAAKIMEASHPKTEKEKELAAMGHPKDKITHKDVLIGRGVLKKEEKESCEDDVKKHEKKMHGKDGEVAKHVDKMHKEESEQLDEITFDKSGRYVHQGKRGAKGAEYGSTDWDKEEQQAKDDMKPKKKKYGSRQNYVRSTRVNETFSEMLSMYQEKGLKSLSEMAKVKEEVEQIDEDMMGYKIRQKHQDKWRVHSPSGEHIGDVTRHENGYQYHGGHATKWDGSEKSPHYKTGVEKSKSEAAKKVASIHKASLSEEVDSEDFEKEMKDQKDKFDGKKKGADVAKASVQAVKNEEVEDETFEVELVLDGTNGYAQETVQERSLTDAEMKKKEDVVMSMKKNVKGFKDRYGDRAKEVMYATATKMAKEEKEDHWHNGYNHVREPISDEPYLDNARGRFHELKKNNPHKRGTPEHKEWHSGASAAYEEHKDILKGN